MKLLCSVGLMVVLFGTYIHTLPYRLIVWHRSYMNTCVALGSISILFGHVAIFALIAPRHSICQSLVAHIGVAIMANLWDTFCTWDKGDKYLPIVVKLGCSWLNTGKSSSLLLGGGHLLGKSHLLVSSSL